MLFITVLSRARDLFPNAGAQAFVLLAVGAVLVNLAELGIFQTFDFVYRDCGRAGINYIASFTGNFCFQIILAFQCVVAQQEVAAVVIEARPGVRGRTLKRKPVLRRGRSMAGHAVLVRLVVQIIAGSGGDRSHLSCNADVGIQLCNFEARARDCIIEDRTLPGVDAVRRIIQDVLQNLLIGHFFKH